MNTLEEKRLLLAKLQKADLLDKTPSYTQAELSSLAGKLMEMRNTRDNLAKIPVKIRTAKQSEALKELSEVIPKVNLQLSVDLAKLQNKTKEGFGKEHTKQLISGNVKEDYAVLQDGNSFAVQRKSYQY